MGRQRGVALITVLLVFALAAVIAGGMLQRSHHLASIAGNQFNSRQAYYFALGGEALARQLLAADRREGDNDSLDEAWAALQQQLPFEIEGGRMAIEIRDLQGRFNLNNVVDESGNPRAQGMEELRRLLRATGLSERYADEWQDWLDRDQQRSNNGAEDADYMDYRSAGRREADVSALRLLLSMQPEDYRRLEPHVTTLPTTTAINVNTATAAALQALVPNLNASRAQQLVERQRNGGFKNMEEFVQLSGAEVGQAALASNYFEVRVTVQYNDRLQYLRSVLRRSSSGAISVVARERGVPFAIGEDDGGQPAGFDSGVQQQQ